MEFKRVLVCADDFGLHAAVDDAVIELAGLGRLSAASCLVDGDSFAANAPRLRASGLQCGLHLNFTEKLGADGLFLPLGLLIRRAWLRRLRPGDVRRQVSRQLDRYETVMGRLPDYVDGHQHVHQFPQIRDALIDELDARYGAAPERPWLRCTLAARQPGVPLGMRAKAGVIAGLGAGRLGRLARRHGYEQNRALLGVYGFQGGAQGYQALLRAWLAVVGEDDLIMCHPAVRAVPGDALGAQRVAEFDTWRSDTAAAWLRQHGVQVVQAGDKGLRGAGRRRLGSRAG